MACGVCCRLTEDAERGGAAVQRLRREPSALLTAILLNEKELTPDDPEFRWLKPTQTQAGAAYFRGATL
jgi:hypothetical protein